MMSYLVRRENFADGTPPPKPTEDNTPPPKKPYNELEFKKRSDTLLQGIYGTTSKEYFMDLIQKELDKGVKENVITMEEGLEFIKGRKKFYDDYIKEQSVVLPRSNFFKGALADTEEGKAMSPGTTATGGFRDGGDGDGGDQVEATPPPIRFNQTPDFLNTRFGFSKDITKNLGLNFSFDPKGLLDKDIYGEPLEGGLSYNKGDFNAGIGIDQFGDPYAGLSFRTEFKKGNPNPGFKGERYSFPTGEDNPGVQENIEKLNKEKRIIFDKKKLRAKELLEKGYSKAKASQIINAEYKGTRNPKSGAAKYVTEAASELEQIGFKIPHGNLDPNATGKEDAAKKRKNVTKKTKQSENRFMRDKQKLGLGKELENAHTANIFQAKKLGVEYPTDALAPQTSKQNQVYAEILNDELKPLYKEQLKLKRAFDQTPTKEISVLIDKNNTAIQNLVASGGKQGKKAANLLRGWNLDVVSGEVYLPEGGFNTLRSVDRGMTDTTLQNLKAKTADDVLARANYEELLKEMKGKKIPTPEKSKTRDMFKKFGKYAKAVAKPVVRLAAPFVPFLGPIGVGMGMSDVAEASTFTKKPDDLGIAYLAGPNVAKNYSEFKESVRGKSDEFEEFVP